jgi:phosphatidate cytidylyltransferase
MNNLQQRLLFGSVSSILMLSLIWFSPLEYMRPLFSCLIGIIIAVSTVEFYFIAKTKKFDPLWKLGTLASFLYAISLYLQADYPSLNFLPYAVLFLTLISVFLYFFQSGNEPIANISVTLMPLIYLALPLGAWISIAFFFPPNDDQEGRIWLFYLLAVTKMTDIGAYFAGSLLGKNKLSPYISPGKSWEGAIGGLLAGVITSFLFSYFSPLIAIKLTFLQSLILGFILSSMGQLGDLAESLIKRDAKVKDSNTLPGLGGILDMVDSLVFTTPIVYIFLKMQKFL